MARSAVPLTPLAMAVVELLHERDMHPYEMTQLMRERRVDYRVKLRAGSLYHTVERLEAQGMIEVVGTQRQGRRPERTVYALTESGRDVFVEQARAMLATPAQEYPQYPVALSAANELDRAEVLEQLRMRVVDLRARIAAEQVVLDHLSAERLPRMYWIEYDYMHHQRQSELDWTERLIEDLDSGRISWPDAKPDPMPELSVVDGGRGRDDDKAS
ncbi:helix-turn-helix transcriptional regulator [Actinophytocola oryzae]|uniref:PadR family transcriptional regulator n=1 Tax=Actinophytocola oryzae TaxID=502181 RepID=A0A4R7W2W3_9PSEU|nr:helix-turn-helix transcriptional regulator [Actinophytocola oryzae]TDV56485.1 PadR family transcriptional regulator [Actinophytocola oryzae]